MLSGMQTIDANDEADDDANDLVSASFEACAAFAAGADASPVCAACGWLETEHGREVAEVRALPARAGASAPKRLAS